MNREIVDINAYHQIIESLVKEGYTIIQVVINPYSVFYYSALEFEPSYSGGGQSIEFIHIKGINITEFLKRNATNDVRNTSAKMQELTLNSPVMNIDFSNRVEWYKFSIAL